MWDLLNKYLVTGSISIEEILVGAPSLVQQYNTTNIHFYTADVLIAFFLSMCNSFIYPEVLIKIIKMVKPDEKVKQLFIEYMYAFITFHSAQLFIRDPAIVIRDDNYIIQGARDISRAFKATFGEDIDYNIYMVIIEATNSREIVFRKLVTEFAINGRSPESIDLATDVGMPIDEYEKIYQQVMSLDPFTLANYINTLNSRPTISGATMRAIHIINILQNELNLLNDLD